MARIKSVGVLCSGGDAPGMNAAIRAVVRYGISRGLKVYGINRGYLGLLEHDIVPMDLSSVANIIQRGGTVLRTSRCPAWHRKSTRKRAAAILREHKIDALVVIGGDGSFTGAMLLERETGFPTMGVPGTIDNDIQGTDDTIGFDTAINTALDSIDRIRDTASSHDRLFIVEVMGRHCGMIATYAGIGGGAETVVVPEERHRLSTIVKKIESGIKRGKTSSIIVVAEGRAGGGMGELLNRQLKREGYNPRLCVLGHTQRGGSPTAKDRMLASAMGAFAVDCLLKGKSGGMTANQGKVMVYLPYRKVLSGRKTLPRGIHDLMSILAN